MPSWEMLRLVVRVRRDDSEVSIAFTMRATGISELRTTLALISSLILVTRIMEAIHSFETSVHTRATRRTIPEDFILHSYRSENLTSYISIFIYYYLSAGLEWNQAHYYCGHLLACCTSSEWLMVIIVE
jgi:hypothetical protein